MLALSIYFIAIYDYMNKTVKKRKQHFANLLKVDKEAIMQKYLLQTSFTYFQKRYHR